MFAYVGGESNPAPYGTETPEMFAPFRGSGYFAGTEGRGLVEGLTGQSVPNLLAVGLALSVGGFLLGRLLK